MCRTALKKQSCAPATATTPYAASAIGSRRRRCQRPRSDTIAGTASNSAATPMRTVTAAAGDHPATISERANDPEVLKVAADNSARPRPAPRARPSAMDALRVTVDRARRLRRRRLRRQPRENLVRRLDRAQIPTEILRPRAVLHGLAHRALHRLRLGFKTERVSQQHRGAQDGADGI